MLLSNAILRTASRRIISTASSHTKRAASSSAFKRAAEKETSKLLPILTATTIVGGWGLMTMQEDETKTAQCLFGKKGTQAKEVEDKFATYWPRNIMILFGPPGMCFYTHKICSFYIILFLMYLFTYLYID